MNDFNAKCFKAFADECLVISPLSRIRASEVFEAAAAWAARKPAFPIGTRTLGEGVRSLGAVAIRDSRGFSYAGLALRDTVGGDTLAS
jgi:hypothetical protein